jgi:UDP-N-acetylglucosamine 4,6-dehydratase
MQGGEIFIPKIPSVRILDLVQAMSDLPIKIIGIRPGEKLHEIMCPSDDSHLTYEFDDHFVIKPSIMFFNRESDFSVNSLNEKGKLVKQGFMYSSENNRFLSFEEIREFNTHGEE